VDVNVLTSAHHTGYADVNTVIFVGFADLNTAKNGFADLYTAQIWILDLNTAKMDVQTFIQRKKMNIFQRPPHRNSVDLNI
jgi:hypothetical protein